MVHDDQIARRRAEVLEWYEDARHKYLRTEALLGRMVAKALRLSGNADAKVESRVKDPDSLADKATKLTADGAFKYADPRSEITDLVGLRVLVPLRTELPAVVALLTELFEVVEEPREHAGVGEDVPGYQSIHLLVRLRPETLADPDFHGLGDPVFEVQARTILQHAWASLQHDLMYKTERTPGPDIRRRLTALAGLLELAEGEFIRVRHEHGEVFAGEELATGDDAARDWLGSLAEQLETGSSPAHRAWYDAARAVVDELGLEDEPELRAALDGWLDRADVVARAVRTSEPWASGPYVLDALLRLALDEDYLDRRSPGGVPAADREAYAAERADLLRRVEGGRQ